MDTLCTRQLARCLYFSLKCIDHKEYIRFSPRNANSGKSTEIRDMEGIYCAFCKNQAVPKECNPYLSEAPKYPLQGEGTAGGREGVDLGEDAGVGIGE